MNRYKNISLKDFQQMYYTLDRSVDDFISSSHRVERENK